MQNTFSFLPFQRNLKENWSFLGMQTQKNRIRYVAVLTVLSLSCVLMGPLAEDAEAGCLASWVYCRLAEAAADAFCALVDDPLLCFAADVTAKAACAWADENLCGSSS